MAATTTPLALPPAGGTGGGVEARRGILPLAATLSAISGVMLVAGLAAAYLAVKSGTHVRPWPPKGTTFDRYTASTISITAAMAMVTIEWAGYGIRKAFRGQALFAFALTVGLGIAFLNGLAYLINGFPFPANASPYATIVYALTTVPFVFAFVAVGAVALTGLRAAGHQLTTDNFSLMRATAILWHAASVIWIIGYYTVFVTK
jgi:heme/copper-type cytochrome/quinol oxidase subunit 3